MECASGDFKIITDWLTKNPEYQITVSSNGVKIGKKYTDQKNWTKIGMQIANNVNKLIKIFNEIKDRDIDREKDNEIIAYNFQLATGGKSKHTKRKTRKSLKTRKTRKPRRRSARKTRKRISRNRRSRK